MFDLENYTLLGTEYDCLYFVIERNGNYDFYRAEGYDYDARRDCAYNAVSTRDLRIEDIQNNGYDYSLESWEEDNDVMDYYDFWDDHNPCPDEIERVLENLGYLEGDYDFDREYMGDASMKTILQRLANSGNSENNKPLINFLLNKIGREKLEFISCEPIR